MQFQPFYMDDPAGPFIQYRGLNDQMMRYTIMVVYPPKIEHEPSIQLNQIPTIKVTGPLLLDTVVGYKFFRFTLDVKQHEQADIMIKFAIRNVQESFFVVPSLQTHWRVAFFSCNGYSSGISPARVSKYQQTSPLWTDVINEGKNTLHLIIGGGDQLYFDSVWERVPGLKQWAEIQDKQTRKDEEFKFVQETLHFYCDVYLCGFMANGMRHVLSHVPSVMSWDDHDIFDGWGSYPCYLQESKVFKGIFECAKRLYLLFQLQTTETLAEQDGFFGKIGFNQVVQCGPDLGIVLPDTRTERSLERVMHPESVDLLFQKMQSLKAKHVVFVVPVPIVYPHNKSAETIKKIGTMVRSISNIFSKMSLKKDLSSSSVFKSAVNLFGEPELLDDLMDHWTADSHQKEREHLIQNLQKYSLDHKSRITFISGDVHLAAMGLTYSCSGLHIPTSNIKNSIALDFFKKPLLEDHRGMFQIVSSAICNLPPPPLVGGNLMKQTHEMRIDQHTCERMLDIFTDHPGSELENNFYLRKRNWALLEMSLASLTIFICSEKEKGSITGQTHRYKIEVPNLSIK